MRRAVIIIAAIVVAVAGVYIYYKAKAEHQASAEVQAKEAPNVHVIVQNGCKIDNLATNISNQLIGGKIIVAGIQDIENSNCIHEHTMIVIRREDAQTEAKLKYLQEKTGIKLVIKATKSDANADFDLILGKDYYKYFRF